MFKYWNSALIWLVQYLDMLKIVIFVNTSNQVNASIHVLRLIGKISSIFLLKRILENPICSSFFSLSFCLSVCLCVCLPLSLSHYLHGCSYDDAIWLEIKSLTQKPEFISSSNNPFCDQLMNQEKVTPSLKGPLHFIGFPIRIPNFKKKKKKKKERKKKKITIRQIN